MVRVGIIAPTQLGQHPVGRAVDRLRLRLARAPDRCVKFRQAADRGRILALAELKFIDRSEAVHFVGPPGTGKSPLGVALGVEAVRAGRRVHFITLADLIDALARAEREGSLRQKIRFYGRFALLIVDEIGYQPVVPGVATCSSNWSTPAMSAAR